MIVTAALHAISPDIGALEGALYPAADDPAFPGSALDTGYLTTRPGTRGSLFYGPRTANRSVVMADEVNKDTVTVPELAGATSMLTEPPAQQPSDGITVPVLSVVGADDALFCNGVAECKLREHEVGAEFRIAVLSGFSAPQSGCDGGHRA
jgi:hypothetical protein